MSIFSHWILTGIYQNIKLEPEEADASWFGTPKPVNSPLVEFDLVTGNQKLTQHVHHRAPANMQDKMVRGQVAYRLPTIREGISFAPDEVHWLRRPGSEHDQDAQSWITAELTQLKQRVRRLKRERRWALLRGGVYNAVLKGIDCAQHAVSYDFDMLATHQVDVSAGGDNEPWSTPATDVLAHLEAWQDLMGQDSVNGAITDAYLTSKAMLYLMQNEHAYKFFSDVAKDEIKKDGFMREFWGIRWHVMNQGYKNDSDEFVKYVNGVADGSERVVFKTNGMVGQQVIAPCPDFAAQGKKIQLVKAIEEGDPSSIKLIVCETSFPGLTRPDDLLVAQVA